jgi:SAM-dependent methyltransferase
LRFYEFGAGWHLLSPLLFWCQGVERQILVDIHPLARATVVNQTITAIQAASERLQLKRMPRVLLRSSTLRDDLEKQYGIEYRAPCDARATGFPEESIDCITTTSTLEHIPRADLEDILAECARILAPGGVASMIIDYKDHYSLCDSRISSSNFLHYSNRHWSLYNPPLHYQNRLRHSDYLNLALTAGFSIIEARTVAAKEIELSEFRALKLARRFSAYDLHDVTTRESQLILRKTK